MLRETPFDGTPSNLDDAGWDYIVFRYVGHRPPQPLDCQIALVTRHVALFGSLAAYFFNWPQTRL